MSITTAELIAYCSASRPTDDVSTTGGAIDANNRPVFTQLASNGTLEAVSSAGGDTTQTITVTGRNAAGVYSTSTATLTGTSPVALSPATTFERVLTCVLSGTAAGIVTLRKSGAGTVVGTIPIGELGFSAMFINSFSTSTGQTRYEKLFLKNTDGALTLTSSTVTLTADPVGGVFTAGVDTALNGTATVANRTNAPAGVAFVAFNVAQSVPNSGNLTAGAAIAVWILQTLGINQVPTKNTFTVTLAGNTI
jgi:hypothetical protein